MLLETILLKISEQLLENVRGGVLEEMLQKIEFLGEAFYPRGFLSSSENSSFELTA